LAPRTAAGLLAAVRGKNTAADFSYVAKSFEIIPDNAMDPGIQPFLVTAQ